MFLPFLVAQGKAINCASGVNKNLHKNVEVLDCKMMWKVIYWSNLIQRLEMIVLVSIRQRSCGKVMFSQVCHSFYPLGGGGSPWSHVLSRGGHLWSQAISTGVGMSGGRYQSPVHVNKEWVLHKCHRESIIKKCFLVRLQVRIQSDNCGNYVTRNVYKAFSI